jgi:hypothetical protein
VSRRLVPRTGESFRTLSSGKDPDGEELRRDARLELMGYSRRLQLTMISFGMDSAEIERIAKDFSNPSS